MNHSVKKYLSAALLLAILGGAAFWAHQKSQTAPQESALVVQDKINLVNSISNLSDDPSITLEEAHGHQKRAALAIEQLKHEQKAIVDSPEKNPERAKLGLYQGILSKCYIAGHDVHWVDETGAISQHVAGEAPLTGDAAIARKVIYEMGGGLVVVIYDKGHEVYGMDGRLISESLTQEKAK